VRTIEHFWTNTKQELFVLLNSSDQGISDKEAAKRLSKQSNGLHSETPKLISLFLRQYKNPLILLLIFAAIVSGILKEYSDSALILVVLLMMGIFGFVQEWHAGKAVQKLQSLVHCTAMVVREGIAREINIKAVVQGDIVQLNAGDIIPADGLLLTSNDLHVNESSLTGESFPVEKFTGTLSENVVLSHITNAVFKGTSVINGSAEFIAVNAGSSTRLGKISDRLHAMDPDTRFEKGIRQFGYMLLRITVIVSMAILIINVLLHKQVIVSLLFSLAVAVGLAPELLPAILTVTMAAGAKKMARKNVIVKKLNVIQNLGQMNILCTDKTGTITEGKVTLHQCLGADGNENNKVKQYACINAFFETGFSNPIDESLRSIEGMQVKNFRKTDEVPYDFIRKRLSIVVEHEGRALMITKGAYNNVMACCTNVEVSENVIVNIDQAKPALDKLYIQMNEEGYRCIAVCYKDVTNDPVINKSDECDMIFLGLLTFEDPLKSGIIQSVELLRNKGIKLKLITGDNVIAARHIASQLPLNTSKVITGADLLHATSDGLQHLVTDYDVFAEIEPAQKESIIHALQQSGHTVGYMGDGINDAQALKISDVGISVDKGVDVAKESASVVLLDKSIDALLEGIIEGRKTFINTQKYIYLTTSANFGNMVSMAIFSLALPFLPLLPTQILLNNFLSDVPTLALASDTVDSSSTDQPCTWNIRNTRKFMLIYGIQSSIFDMVTFAVIYFIFESAPQVFRTAWFLESLLTEVLIIFIIRTRKSVFSSRPSSYLILLSIIVMSIAMFLPYLNIGESMGFVELPFTLLICMVVISITYGFTSEFLKRKYLLISNS
jgi:P-type Mg2+ transporter